MMEFQRAEAGERPFQPVTFLNFSEKPQPRGLGEQVRGSETINSSAITCLLSPVTPNPAYRLPGG